MYSDMLKADDAELMESFRSSVMRGKVSDNRTCSNVSEQENVDDEDEESSSRSIEASLFVDAMGKVDKEIEERSRTIGETGDA